MDKSESEKAPEALKRAQKMAYLNGARFDLQVPVWRDNRVVYLDPKVELEKPYFKSIRIEPVTGDPLPDES